MTTGFVWHERYAWHDIGTGAGPWRAGGMIEPGAMLSENGLTKRRVRNLFDACGLLAHLDQLPVTAASEEQLARFHTARHIARVKELSAGEGGEVGFNAIVGRGSYEIAALASGGVIAAVEAVLTGRVNNAYALVRPPGHHALADEGKGFCIFGNVPVALLDARARLGLGRAAVVDWDVHHGNGTQAAFYSDPNTLTISLHQSNFIPPNSGFADEIGEGDGVGYNINVPLPPGSGIGAYRHALERVVVPALRAFNPDLIVIACGFDAAAEDPLGRMLLTPEAFGDMTGVMMDVAADCCDGRLVLEHEGGYSPGLTPFCALKAVERLAGVSMNVDDPYAMLGGMDGQDLAPHQAAVIDAIAEAAVPRLRA